VDNLFKQQSAKFLQIGRFVEVMVKHILVSRLYAFIHRILERETPKFISPLLWRPNSPDLNPVDYSVWSILQEQVYKTCITDLVDLKHRIRIRTEWAKLDHAVIAAAVRQWHHRLSAYVRADGGHFEHCFYF